MKKLTALQINLLHSLNDGNCHSGEALGQLNNVSRAAVWKQIHALIKQGIQIERQANGYRLIKPFIPLNSEEIIHNIDPELRSLFDLHLFYSIDSTNHYLKSAIGSKLLVCCAEEQTQGRGRFGRTWLSPFGENIYFSVRWPIACPLASLSGFSLVVSLAVHNCLANYEKNIKIKWPNDLLWQERKLGGILVEIQAESHGNAQVIIGIGINVNSSKSPDAAFNNERCSLFDISNHYYNRNELIGALLNSLYQYIHLFLHQNFSIFQEQWLAVDYLLNKKVTINQLGDRSIQGRACGIDELGQLIVEDIDKNLHCINSGEASTQEI